MWHDLGPMSSEPSQTKRRRRIFLGFVLLPFVLWGSLAAALDRYGLRQAGELVPVDAVVVAGAGVREGGLPSVALHERTRVASERMRAGQAPVLALTGGVGDYPPSEAEVARRLAVAWGVDPSRIVLEDTSTSTEENAAHLAAVLGADRIVVVTDAYHVFRVERVFGRHFREVHGVGVKSTPWVRVRGALREVLAVSLYAATGRLGARPEAPTDP